MNIKKASLQALFNKMWNGLRRQGWERSLDSNGKCCFRGPNGMKCAAGHILDDKYIPECANTFGFLALPIAKTISHNKSLFTRYAQRAHDLSLGTEKMEYAMRKLASGYKLKIP